MNIQFRKIHLLQLPEVDADALIDLAGDKQDSGLHPPALPKGVTRSKTISRSNLDEIIWDIEHGDPQNITPLEWIHCLYNKEKWDDLNPERSRKTSEAIWKAAEQNVWLKQRLFRNLVLYHGEKINFAESLSRELFSYTPQNNLDTKQMKIISILKKDYFPDKLATLCFQYFLTPDELFSANELPYVDFIINKIIDNIVNVFSSYTNLNQGQYLWLIKCLDKMDGVQQLKSVEQLLVKVDPELGTKYSELINWLRQYYGSAVPNSRWNELSPEAKAAMRKWLGAVSYQDFQRLVNLILDRVHLAEHEHRRLKSRSGFWSNYSDRFERIRILLPQSSVNILGSYLNHQDVEILREDGSDPTEVCIFDFGDWYVVEFFRGNGSETRLFARDGETELKLFNSQLSIKKLRCLGLNKPIHDHVFCWQYYCERWLKQHNIFPNQGTTHFKGIPHRYSRYSEQTGLPQPTYDNQRKRDRSLGYWLKDIAKLEMGITGYC